MNRTKSGKVHLAALVAAILAATLCFTVVFTPHAAHAAEIKERAVSTSQIAPVIALQATGDQNTINPDRFIGPIGHDTRRRPNRQQSNWLQQHKKEICIAATTAAGVLNSGAMGTLLSGHPAAAFLFSFGSSYF